MQCHSAGKKTALLAKFQPLSPRSPSPPSPPARLAEQAPNCEMTQRWRRGFGRLPTTAGDLLGYRKPPVPSLPGAGQAAHSRVSSSLSSVPPARPPPTEHGRGSGLCAPAKASSGGSRGANLQPHARGCFRRRRVSRTRDTCGHLTLGRARARGGDAAGPRAPLVLLPRLWPADQPRGKAGSRPLQLGAATQPRAVPGAPGCAGAKDARSRGDPEVPLRPARAAEHPERRLHRAHPYPGPQRQPPAPEPPPAPPPVRTTPPRTSLMHPRGGASPAARQLPAGDGGEGKRLLPGRANLPDAAPHLSSRRRRRDPPPPSPTT